MIFKFFVLIGAVAANIQKLTSSDFEKKVSKSDSVWVVGFLASWCGHCQQFKPDFEKAAKALSGVVNVGEVDENQQELMGKFGIKGFPTLKVFVPGRKSPIDYDGQRTAEAVVEFALKHATETVRSRLSGKSSKKTESSKQEGNSDVIVLTDKNFKTDVLADEEGVWLVEFYAPWCGHCKNLAPIWEKVASKLKGKVKVAKVDATVETVTAQKYNIKGYPSIKLFPVGKKGAFAGGHLDYEQERSETSILQFAQSHAAAQKAEQILSDEQFRSKCEKMVCVVAVLPHLVDTGAEGRNRYLNQLNLAIRGSAAPVEFFWTQAGDQSKVEDALNLAFGYPAMFSISLDKKMYGIHRGTFETDSIRQFLTSLSTGSVPLSDLPSMPKLKTNTAWDGKDYKEEL